MNLPHHISYMSGMWEALDYLKKAYPKGASNEQAASKDLVLLGISLNSFSFLDEVERCHQIDRSRLYLVILTYLFTGSEIEKIRNYNLQGCFPKTLSEEVIREILASIPKPCSKHENKREERTQAVRVQAGSASKAGKKIDQ